MPRTGRFPREVRLTRAADYRRVFSGHPRRSSDRWMTVYALPNDRGQARLGLAISRKAARRAVDRNRIKRLVRETFRHHRAELGAMDLVVVARAGIAELSAARLRTQLLRHWRRLAPCKDS